MHPVVAEIFGPDLIIVIIVVAVVLFGGTQIPKLARSLGSAQSEFKKGLAEGGKGKSDDTDAKATDAKATDAKAADAKAADAGEGSAKE
ncbi:MAG TPA: twin-arginine translocase TatA/TatE family subunit [Acidimicrobiales bacterium]|nr:twin-arginine translocase TatA/TatE family subunit [Acidimicrobiales bacterium]